MVKMISKIFIIMLSFIVVFAGCSAEKDNQNMPKFVPKNFQECANAGYPVMESYPRQCAFENKTFVEEIPSPKQDGKICTMEYAPVCGVNGITYGNKCMAGNIEISHSGEC